MIKLFEDKNNCCGCTACVSACPINAIHMEYDEKGFLYPIINSEVCVECGICKKVCQNQGITSRDSTIKKVFALQHKSNEVLKKSSSGGAFTAISDILLSRGGVVFGSIMDENFMVYHTKAHNSTERDKMRGSKYVQSEMRECFTQIKSLLDNDKEVMFVGTPCQVAGLNSFLNKAYEKLTTVDFLCHGTPSVLLLKEHIAFLQRKYNKKIVSYNFRDKKYGWSPTETAVCENGSVILSLSTLKLSKLFLLNLNLRPSCFSCKYTNTHRHSDITIADFWGVEKILNRCDNKGTSLLLTNTQKGDSLLLNLLNSCELIESKLESVIKIQKRLSMPSIPKFNVDVFWQTYFEKGYEAVINKYSKIGKKQAIRVYMRRFLYTIHLDNLIIYIRSKIK